MIGYLKLFLKSKPYGNISQLGILDWQLTGLGFQLAGKDKARFSLTGY